MKKKGILSVLLSMLLSMALLSLTACGSMEEEYARGTMAAGSFESGWLGVRFDAPEGYVMLSEEELDAMLLAGAESYRERYGEAGEAFPGSTEAEAVYELMVYLPEEGIPSSGNPNIILAVEKSLAEPETYAQTLESQVDTIYAGASVTWENAGTAQIGSMDYSQYTVTADYGILTLYQRYYLAKKGGRLISYTLTYTQDKAADADMLMEAFTAY